MYMTVRQSMPVHNVMSEAAHTRSCGAQGYALSEQLRTACDAPARERLAEAAVPSLMRAAAALSPSAASADSVSGQSAALVRSMLRTLLVRLHGSAGDLSAEVRSLVDSHLGSRSHAASSRACRLSDSSLRGYTGHDQLCCSCLLFAMQSGC